MFESRKSSNLKILKVFVYIEKIEFYLLLLLIKTGGCLKENWIKASKQALI